MIINVNIYYYIKIFKIDIYFSKFSLAIRINKKELIKRVDKNLIFELERQKALEKELNCKFIRINTNNDLDYEISDIQKFIVDFDNNKTKDEIKKR